MKNVDNVSEISRADIEKIAMQHTVDSAIANEFQSFSFEEKITLVSVIHTAFSQAFATGKPICPSIAYNLTPDVCNQFLAHSCTTGKEYSQSPLKVLTLNQIGAAVDQIYQREINYHEYDGQSVVIWKARFIPTFKIITDHTDRKIEEINVYLCSSIVEELNKILVKSKGSLPTALKLTVQLLNQDNPQVKDID